MAQMGFFDLSNRYASLDAKKDPLVEIDAMLQRLPTRAREAFLLAQLGGYVARGGRFGAGDLVSVLGGANDIFQGLPVAGASANPVAAITPVALRAAGNINALVNSVSGAGARARSSSPTCPSSA